MKTDYEGMFNELVEYLKNQFKYFHVTTRDLNNLIENLKEKHTEGSHERD
jgi:hypothetical protein